MATKTPRELQAKDIMKHAGVVWPTELLIVGDRTPLTSLAQIVCQGGWEAVLVADDSGFVSGIVSKTDVLIAFAKGWPWGVQLSIH